jgi:DNA-binding response OmpR family regulator
MRIAVLEDDPTQREHLAHTLVRHLVLGDEKVSCHEFHTGEALRRALRRETFDLLVLDWNLPDLDGIELLRWLRGFANSTVPVVMLSSRASERDVVAALASGANDYVVKPFRPLELCARILRLLPKGEPEADGEAYRFGDWLLDPSALTISCVPLLPAKQHAPVRLPLALTEREFRLALALLRHPNKAVSREHLMEGLGLDGAQKTRLLDGLVYRLRSKLMTYDPDGLRMQTIYGQGYRLAVAERAPISGADNGDAHDK